MVSLTHGEGFGLPLFEAAREGLPVMTIGWSGQLDFLFHDGKEYFTSVDFTIQQIQSAAVWDGVLVKESKWAFADQGSYKMKLRDLNKNWDKAKETALELKKIIEEKYKDEVLFSRFVDEVYGDKVVEDDEIDALFASLAEEE